MSEKISVICLHQPWATLWALGEKQIETRHWRLPERYLGKTVYIHAAARFTAEARMYWSPDFPEFRDALLRHLDVIGKDAPEQEGVTYHKVGTIKLPFQAIIGKVTLAECLPTGLLLSGSATRPPISAKERAFGNYELGRFGFVGKNHALLDRFIPTPGRQAKLFEFTLPETCTDDELKLLATTWQRQSAEREIERRREYLISSFAEHGLTGELFA